MSIQIGQTYKNEVGAVMVIKQNVAAASGINVISNDIWIAESQDNIFGPKAYLVTQTSLDGARYALIEDAPSAEGKDS